MKICIIGGGTAGWLAANYINTMQPEHELTVVESSKIGIIGAGEGSTGVFSSVIHQGLKIGFEEFMLGAKTTQKMGIRFHNWQGDGRSYIAPLDNTDTSLNESWDLSLMYHTAQYGGKMAYSSTVNGVLGAKGLSSMHSVRPDVVHRHSYHFDGHEVGKFLKSVLQGRIGSALKVIDSEVIAVNQDEQGYVRSVKLKTGQAIKADVWVDASGFARVLGKYMNNGWHSYRDFLTCNTAIPFLLPHGDRIDPLTEAYALSSGWMWQIPTQDRRGCGYVFDSNFITEDQALKEIESVLGRKVDPIKVIKFEPGRYERTFVKNTVTIGLAQSFLEPLQATSIHGTIGILYDMMNYWLRPWGIASDIEADKLNTNVATAIDYFADLLQLHYRGGRSDTDFWRHTQQLPERPHLIYLKNVCEHRWPNNKDWTHGYGAGYGVFIYPLLEYGWLKHPRDYLNYVTADNIEQSVREKYLTEQNSITNVTSQALDHTVLISRIRTTGQLKPPIESYSINQQQLHPLLRF